MENNSTLDFNTTNNSHRNATVHIEHNTSGIQLESNKSKLYSATKDKNCTKDSNTTARREQNSSNIQLESDTSKPNLKSSKKDSNKNISTVTFNENIKSEFNYVVIAGIGFFILFIILLYLKKRKKPVPIVSKKLHKEHNENFFNDCVKKQDWETINAILEDPSFGDDIKQKASQVLKSKSDA